MIKYFLLLSLFFNIPFDSNAQNTQDTLSSPNANGPTKVYVSLVVNNISEVNAATQILKADFFLMTKWNDPRLTHNGKNPVVKNLEDIWTPLITISNRLNINKSFPEVVSIQNDGTVTYFQRVFGEFPQELYFKEFPFDNQTFIIKIIAMGFTADKVELLPDTESVSGVSEKFTMPDWKILDWKYDNAPYSIIKGAPILPALTFSFRAKRESGFYILVFVIPLVLIIMMSWMAFWLDSKLSGSQISIATTSMLTLIAYRFVVSGGLPKISYLTRMDVFVLGSSILIFFTLLQSVVTATFYSRGNEIMANKMDRQCRWIFPLLYIIVCLIAFVF